MPTEDEMTVDERRKYLKRMKARYMKASRRERSALLSEMEQVTGMLSLSLTRLVHATSLERQKRKSVRQRSYGAEVEEVIVQIWESLDYICAERLTPVLSTMAQHLARFAVVKLTEAIHEQLKTISRATVSRILRRFRSRRRRLPQKGAERANQVTKGVPMGRIAWDITEPGHFEVDLVYHSGESTAGEHGHTIQMVDVATGWSERVAVMGRGQRAMEAGFEQRLASAAVYGSGTASRQCESRSSTITWCAIGRRKEWGCSSHAAVPTRKTIIASLNRRMTPWCVSTLATCALIVGAQIEAMNTLYEQMWLYSNLFQPVLHLIKKTAVGDKVRRTWDQACTPFERLKATGKLSAEHEQRLQTLYEQTNPRRLREEIYQGLARLWSQSMPSATEVA